MKNYKKLFFNNDYNAIQNDWDSVLGIWWHEKKENEMVNKQIVLTEEECYVSITELYDTIARKLGYKETKDLQYDCKKILVSRLIFNKVYQYYQSVGTNREEFTMYWCCFGPKASLEKEDYVVEIQNGFIIKK